MAEEPKTGNDPLTEGVSLFCYYQANRLMVTSLVSRKKAEMLLMANVVPRQGEALQPQPNPQFST